MSDLPPLDCVKIESMSEYAANNLCDLQIRLNTNDSKLDAFEEVVQGADTEKAGAAYTRK